MISKNKYLFLLIFFNKNICIMLSALKSAGLLKVLPYTAKDMCRKNISPMMARGAYGVCSRLFLKTIRVNLYGMIFRLSDRFLKWSFFINFNAGRIK